jgi:hypothetical protein
MGSATALPRQLECLKKMEAEHELRVRAEMEMDVHDKRNITTAGDDTPPPHAV